MMYCTIIYRMKSNRSDYKKIEGFEWDEGNSDKNWIKHNVHYKEAEEVFLNSPRVLLPDTEHSLIEKRLTLLGFTDKGRKLIIIFTVRNNKFRVISARDMNKKERQKYEKHSQKT